MAAFLGFVEKSLCEWRGLAQGFIHSRTSSHGADSLMRWIRHLLHWGWVNLKSLWRTRHLSACSGTAEKNYKINFTTKIRNNDNNVATLPGQLLAAFTLNILTVRFWIPSEKAPICLTVPSESSICKTRSSFQTQ